MKGQKSAIFAKKQFKHKYTIDKNYRKVKDNSHGTGKNRGAAHSKYNLKYSITKEISGVFHNGSNYNYHFIIKELRRN